MNRSCSRKTKRRIPLHVLGDAAHPALKFLDACISRWELYPRRLWSTTEWWWDQVSFFLFFILSFRIHALWVKPQCTFSNDTAMTRRELPAKVFSHTWQLAAVLQARRSSRIMLMLYTYKQALNFVLLLQRMQVAFGCIGTVVFDWRFGLSITAHHDGAATVRLVCSSLFLFCFCVLWCQAKAPQPWCIESQSQHAQWKEVITAYGGFRKWACFLQSFSISIQITVWLIPQ